MVVADMGTASEVLAMIWVWCKCCSSGNLYPGKAVSKLHQPPSGKFQYFKHMGYIDIVLVHAADQNCFMGCFNNNVVWTKSFASAKLAFSALCWRASWGAMGACSAD